MRTCSTCKETKDVSQFNKDKSGKDGICGVCRECCIERQRNWRKNNKEKIKEYNTERFLMQNYGITVDDWKDMFESQNKSCAICKSKEHGGKNFHVDHDHKTGKVRAILCHPCNIGLGMFKDNTRNLMAAIIYLCKH